VVRIDPLVAGRAVPVHLDWGTRTAFLPARRDLPVLLSVGLLQLGVPVTGMLFSAPALGETLSMAKLWRLALISSGAMVLIIDDFFWKSRSEK